MNPHAGPADCRGCTARELGEWLRIGHGPAWDEAVRRYTHRVVVVLLARGIPLDAAEDLAQEAWVRLLARQRSGALHMIELPGLAIAQAIWLARESARSFARRQALVARQAKFADLGAPEPWALAEPERSAHQGELFRLIDEELARCPARAQRVFLAAYSDDAPSHAELARTFGLSVQRVRQLLCEVRSRLREVVEAADREVRA